MRPLKILVHEKKLQIRWDDQSISVIPLTDLRRHCPCADCAAEREENSSSYVPIFSGDQLTIVNIQMAGHYAVSISWKDGHRTGLYEFSYLVDISKNNEDL